MFYVVLATVVAVLQIGLWTAWSYVPDQNRDLWGSAFVTWAILIVVAAIAITTVREVLRRR